MDAILLLLPMRVFWEKIDFGISSHQYNPVVYNTPYTFVITKALIQYKDVILPV